MGHHLVEINGGSTLRWDLDQSTAALIGAGRPVLLTFEDPYAVHPDVARAAMVYGRW